MVGLLFIKGDLRCVESWPKIYISTLAGDSWGSATSKEGCGHGVDNNEKNIQHSADSIGVTSSGRAASGNWGDLGKTRYI